MIRIQKTPAPEWFQTYADQSRHDSTYSYDNLREKVELKECLLSEQGFLCCYCGRAVTPSNSHNEHFRPQKKYPEQALCYDNIHASCLSSPDIHCGNAKRDTFDEDLCISPLDVDERRFLYSQSGHIFPKAKDDVSASYMIKLLNLNSAWLVTARRELLAKLFSPSDSLTLAQLQELHAAYHFRNSDNHYRTYRQVVTTYIDNEITRLSAIS